MKTLSILTLSMLLFSSCQSTTISSLPEDSEETIIQEIKEESRYIDIPVETKQIIRVTTKEWNEKNGELQRFEEKDKKWIKVGEPIEIILGRNGLGWGMGLHTTPLDAKYIKKEGDGRAPAGLFRLGNAFGYQDFKINFPYKTYKRTNHCVDDSNSQFYNTIIDSNNVKKDYKSFEYMRLKNNLYKYGITVQHNPDNIQMGGSCIFIHIKSSSKKGTAGCTAMKEQDITEILQWLEEDKNPLLLQLTQDELQKRVHDSRLK